MKDKIFIAFFFFITLRTYIGYKIYTHYTMHNMLVSLSSRLLRFMYVNISQQKQVCQQVIFVNYCVFGEDL